MRPDMFIGSYERSGGHGLYPAWLDSLGAISLGPPDTRIGNASFGLLDHRCGTAWFVEEQEPGAVSAWQWDDQVWTPLGRIGTGGASPCHLVRSPDGTLLAVANNDGGVAALVELDPETGALGKLAGVLRNEVGARSHAGCVRFAGDRIFIVDRGLDRVLSCEYGAAGFGEVRTAFAAPRGSGPRQLLLRDDLALLACELTARLMLLRATGEGFELLDDIATDAAATPGNLAGHLAFQGDRIFVSNRGADTVASFRIDGERLRREDCWSSHGRSPRHFAMCGSYLVVTNEQDGLVCVLDIANGGRIAGTAIVPGAAFVLAMPL